LLILSFLNFLIHILRILKSNKDELISSFLSPPSPSSSTSIAVSSPTAVLSYSSVETKTETQITLNTSSIVSTVGFSTAPTPVPVPDVKAANSNKSVKLLSLLKGPVAPSSSRSQFSQSSEKNEASQLLLSSLVEKPSSSTSDSAESAVQKRAESRPLCSSTYSTEISPSPPLSSSCHAVKGLLTANSSYPSLTCDPLLSAAVKGDQLLALLSKTSSATSRDSTSPSSSSQSSSIVNNLIRSLEELQNQKGESSSVVDRIRNDIKPSSSRPFIKENADDRPSSLTSTVSSSTTRSRGNSGSDILLSFLTSAPATQTTHSPNSNSLNYQPLAKKLFPEASSISSTVDLNEVINDHSDIRKSSFPTIVDSIDINPRKTAASIKPQTSPSSMPALIPKQQNMKEIRLPDTSDTTVNPPMTSSTSLSTKKPVMLISPSDLDI
jgi:hypothetical protein